jgi:hypothetical protein
MSMPMFRSKESPSVMKQATLFDGSLECARRLEAMYPGRVHLQFFDETDPEMGEPWIRSVFSGEIYVDIGDGIGGALGKAEAGEWLFTKCNGSLRFLPGQSWLKSYELVKD